MEITTAAAPPFFKNGYLVSCEDTKEAVYIDPGDEVDDLVAHARADGQIGEHRPTAVGGVALRLELGVGHDPIGRALVIHSAMTEVAVPEIVPVAARHERRHCLYVARVPFPAHAVLR